MAFDLFIVLLISYLLIGFIIIKQLKFSDVWFGVSLPFWPIVLVGKIISVIILSFIIFVKRFKTNKHE
jgi:hypothetical protein